MGANCCILAIFVLCNLGLQNSYHLLPRSRSSLALSSTNNNNNRPRERRKRTSGESRDNNSSPDRRSSGDIRDRERRQENKGVIFSSDFKTIRGDRGTEKDRSYLGRRGISSAKPSGGWHQGNSGSRFNRQPYPGSKWDIRTDGNRDRDRGGRGDTNNTALSNNDNTRPFGGWGGSSPGAGINTWGGMYMNRLNREKRRVRREVYRAHPGTYISWV